MGNYDKVKQYPCRATGVWNMTTKTFRATDVRDELRDVDQSPSVEGVCTCQFISIREVTARR